VVCKLGGIIDARGDYIGSFNRKGEGREACGGRGRSAGGKARGKGERWGEGGGGEGGRGGGGVEDGGRGREAAGNWGYRVTRASKAASQPVSEQSRNKRTITHPNRRQKPDQPKTRCTRKKNSEGIKKRAGGKLGDFLQSRQLT